MDKLVILSEEELKKVRGGTLVEILVGVAVTRSLAQDGGGKLVGDFASEYFSELGGIN